ncbi:MAG: hypothetical protein HQ559_01645 [Lentisphaerae bacterium]|nr:hypothetical protein [Lentisphaerota bacterium]
MREREDTRRAVPIIMRAPSGPINKPGSYRCQSCSEPKWWVELTDGICITCRHPQDDKKRKRS